MRLNLGSGPFPAEGWTNVDAREMPGVDVIADIADLPFDTGSIEAIYAGHVFEHLTYLDQLPRALDEMKRLLAPGAPMMVVGPDLERALDRFPHEVKGMWPRDPYGADPSEHSWPPTADMMRAALEHAGFTAIEIAIGAVDAEEWPLVSSIGWQFAFECRVSQQHAEADSLGP